MNMLHMFVPVLEYGKDFAVQKQSLPFRRYTDSHFKLVTIIHRGGNEVVVLKSAKNIAKSTCYRP